MSSFPSDRRSPGSRDSSVMDCNPDVIFLRLHYDNYETRYGSCWTQVLTTTSRIVDSRSVEIPKVESPLKSFTTFFDHLFTSRWGRRLCYCDSKESQRGIIIVLVIVKEIT